MRLVLFHFLLVFPILASAVASIPAAEDGKVWLFVGTYTGGKSKGIYRVEFDTQTGDLSNLQLAAQADNPSFLAIAPGGKALYCVNEIGQFRGKKSGAVQAFRLDASQGKLTPLNQQPSGGDGPCHLVVDLYGKNILAANYGGGSVCVVPIRPDGSLGEPTSFIQHKGTSIDPARQEGPHGHSINLDAANRFAFAADLGLDKILVYQFDPAAGTLQPHNPAALSVPGGSGPRHFAFHPSGKFAYVINEMKNTIQALSYDSTRGTLKSIQSLPTLPATFKGNSSTAEVVVHPSGQFLYGSNRGHDSIASYRIDATTGELTPTGHATEGIRIPRNFNIDPTGKFLVVANQDGASLVVFAIDQKTGVLKPTGKTITVDKPVCVKFVTPK